jgi:hypothetical protein
MRPSLLIVVCFLQFAAGAELWTNMAGRTIEATLEKFDGVTVTFTRTNGTSLTMPLRVLNLPDQQRVKIRSGHNIAPAFVQGAYRDARTVLDRFEALPAERRTEEARAAAIRTACAIFDARLKPRASELQNPQVRDEIKRLRDSLR